MFNNRNDPRIYTNLHFAERVDDLTFNYGGEIKGVNTQALEGVPSVDRLGNLFFVSTRSYKESLSTLYRGRLDGANVSGVQLVPGISRRLPGIVTFDAEIAADGDTLFIVDGRFTGGEVPETADIAVAVRDASGFRRLPNSGDVLKNVNTDALEYAPAITPDGSSLVRKGCAEAGPIGLLRFERIHLLFGGNGRLHTAWRLGLPCAGRRFLWEVQEGDQSECP